MISGIIPIGKSTLGGSVAETRYLSSRVPVQDPGSHPPGRHLCEFRRPGHRSPASTPSVRAARGAFHHGKLHSRSAQKSERGSAPRVGGNIVYYLLQAAWDQHTKNGFCQWLVLYLLPLWLLSELTTSEADNDAFLSASRLAQLHCKASSTATGRPFRRCQR